MTSTTSACTVCQPPALEALVESEPALAVLWQDLPRRQFSAGTLLQQAGETSTRCWQVRSGVVRLFYLNEHGTERNRSFHGAGSWVAGNLPPLALPSPYAIEALAPVEAVELAYATLQQWQRSFPHIGPLLEEGLGHVFQQHAHREAELWHPAATTALERALHPAGHGPNSSSLFRPQAAVVAVAISAEILFLYL